MAWWICLAWLAAEPAAPGPEHVGFFGFLAPFKEPTPPSDVLRSNGLHCSCWFPTPRHVPPGVLNAEPKPGPWPVVLFSHGLAAFDRQSESLCAHWASHGFVVLAVDHPATCSSDLRFFSTLSSVRRRPRELQAALARLKALGELPKLRAWRGLADETRIAAAGHSLGAGTAMLLGGALLDTSRFPRLGPMPPADRAEHVALADPRVKCVVAFAPGTEPFFRDESLRSLKVPTLILDASRDPITPPARHGERVFQHAAGPREYGVLQGAGHVSFMDPRLIPKLPWVVRAQHWPTMPDRRAEALVKAATTAFLDRQLCGGKRFPQRPQADDLVWRVAP